MMISIQLQLGYRSSSPTHLHSLQLTLSSVIKLDFKWNYNVLANTGELWKLGSLLLNVIAENQPLEHELTTRNFSVFLLSFPDGWVITQLLGIEPCEWLSCYLPDRCLTCYKLSCPLVLPGKWGSISQCLSWETGNDVECSLKHNPKTWSSKTSGTWLVLAGIYLPLMISSESRKSSSRGKNHPRFLSLLSRQEAKELPWRSCFLWAPALLFAESKQVRVQSCWLSLGTLGRCSLLARPPLAGVSLYA